MFSMVEIYSNYEYLLSPLVYMHVAWVCVCVYMYKQTGQGLEECTKK